MNLEPHEMPGGQVNQKTPPISSEFASGDARRVENNVMRHQYRVLTDEEKANMLRIKDRGKEFYDLCDEIGSSRKLSFAKTKIEEAVMWAVKHITN